MNKKLNEKYLTKIKECSKYDTENGHSEADSILCELLLELGYADVIEEFQNLEKWYS
jgi:hypothetical protein